MWTKPEEQGFLISYLKPHHRMFEYGAGYSTLELPRYVKSYHSVEHNWEWYLKLIKEGLPNNVMLRFMPNNLPWHTVDGSLEEFSDYISVAKYFAPYDVIFIDGRARVECSRFIVEHDLLTEDGVIFWHDFGPKMKQADGTSRAHYNVALDWLDVVDSVETMYMFKPKTGYHRTTKI